MANRITNKQLQTLVERLNKITGNAVEAYTKQEDGNFKANIGTFVLSSCYGGVELEQIVNNGGGVRTISPDGYGTKKQLETFLRGYIAGIESNF